MTETFAKEDRFGHTPQMVIMVGLSRTGKSTFVNKFVKIAAKANGKPFVILSGDDIRRALKVRYESKLEPQVHATMSLMAEAIMQRRQHVVIDETNLSEKDRERWMDFAAKHDYNWTIVEIEQLDEETHKRECAKHNYPWQVIENQRKRYEPCRARFGRNYTLIRKDEAPKGTPE